MKILLLLSSIPYDLGEAIDVVSHEVVRLMSHEGHNIYVQPLIREKCSAESSEREEYAKQSFASQPLIQLLPAIYLADLTKSQAPIINRLNFFKAIFFSFPGLRRLINPYFFPALNARPALNSIAIEINPDVLVSIWSWEALAASYSIKGIPKFVYYGNPDHKPARERLRFPHLFDISTKGFVGQVKFYILKLLNHALEIQHIRMMSSCEVTANNSLIDSNYYTEKGHPQSIYLQNMWPDAIEGPQFQHDKANIKKIHIIGSVGNLGATGNTFGLYFLGTQLLPQLKTKLKGEDLVIDIFGGGKLQPSCIKPLSDPMIKFHGWVEDINSPIRQATAFLVLTNSYGFTVGNTRILLAWSLGACVIAHSFSKLSMPELEHGVNVLLGETDDELAELILQVSSDPQLRERIGRGGYSTFRKYYRSSDVVPKMLVEIKKMTLSKLFLQEAE
jgi:glycosyltransferase involved in cell wall biosynthesis